MTFATLMSDVATVIAERAGLTLAPVLFDARNVTSTGCDRWFCLDLQSSNTGKYRGSNPPAERTLTNVKVSVLWQVNPHDAFRSQQDAADVEELIIRALLDPEVLPAHAVGWQGTARSLTQSREYLLLVLSFAVEHDLPTADY